MTYGDIQGMLALDREWHLIRLTKQLRSEAEEMKKAKASMKVKKGRRKR